MVISEICRVTGICYPLRPFQHLNCGHARIARWPDAIRYMRLYMCVLYVCYIAHCTPFALMSWSCQLPHTRASVRIYPLSSFPTTVGCGRTPFTARIIQFYSRLFPWMFHGFETVGCEWKWKTHVVFPFSNWTVFRKGMPWMLYSCSLFSKG